MPVDVPHWVQRGIVDPLVPSLQVGAVTGVAGITLGAVYGLFKSPRPVPVAAAAGTITFLYGSSTFYFRGAFLAATGQDRTQRSELAATGAASALTGAISGATHRTVSAILRTGGVVGLLGIAGQAGYHSFVSSANQPRVQKTFVDRIAGMLPMRAIPDAEYEGILNDRITQINAEIGVLDDRIANLRRQSNSSSPRAP